MRRYGLAALAVVSLVAAVLSQAADGGPDEAAVAKDLQAFKGTWRLSAKEEDGKKFSDEEIKDVIATVDGSGNVSVRHGDKVINEGTVRLDPTKGPKAVDVTFTGGQRKGQKVLGIYEIEGDVFRVCVARPGDGRPAEFSAGAGSGRTIVVYKREKSERQPVRPPSTQQM
jgi:uncharacterized protein (TIGR03067 family)